MQSIVSFFKKLTAQKLGTLLTIPTILTLTRIALIPVIMHAMYVQQWVFALVFFLCAVITDVLDGYLARRWNQQSFLGACLDPIADKLLIVSLFFTLMALKTPFVPVWFFWLVLVKEVIQVVGAGLIFLSKGELVVRPVVVGRLSMFLQTCFIFVLLAGYLYRLPPVLYAGLLFSVTLLLCVSLVQYLFVGIKQLRK